MIRHSQCSHTGASAWIAHSKLSNTCDSDPWMIVNALSYSFPQSSQVAMLVSYLSDLRVRAAFFAAADRELAERRRAAALAWRDSAVCDAARRDSRFNAVSLEF
jgi:hypothetical protein